MNQEPALALKRVLQKYWGYDSFLPLQQEAMECVLADRDSVVVLPTGGGKSLCFQAPAMCRQGLAVVVSPLISLMKDQVDALRSCGIAAAAVNSTLALDERRQVADQIRAGEIRLLYVAPERLVTERMLQFLRGLQISLFAIDEAHCISSWGHDFRPEYRGLRVLRQQFPDIGIHAYTATATEQVRLDIVQQLGLRDPRILVGSFDRSNLIYRVRPRQNLFTQIRSVIDKHANDSGVIYCISRAEVDRTSASLNALGYSALPYHAGMSDRDREQNQQAFIDERARIIVATVAFGMGIDKSNVRYVVHAGMPKSLENYQQESGRAGRDGLDAECWLFYSGADFHTWRQLMDNTEGDSNGGAAQALSAMFKFCAGVECRHRALVRHFGQSWDKPNCSACDVCLGELNLVEDPLILGQKILSCVVRVGERFGGDYVSLVLCGSRDQRILQNGHERLSTWGLLSQENRRSVRDWIEQLTSQSYLEKFGEYQVLRLTALGRQLLKGEGAPRLLQPTVRREKVPTDAPADSWEGVDRGLVQRLRELRREKAIVANVPSYIVFGDAALRDMARRRPSSLARFLDIRGVGEKKCADYGDDFVQCIRDYCDAQQLKMDIAVNADDHNAFVDIPENNICGPALAAFPLFDQQLSVRDVATQLKRASSTVYGYLESYLREKRRFDPTPWLDADTAQRVEAAAEQVGLQRLKPIYDVLQGQVPYDDIRLVVACLRNRELGGEDT